MLGNRGLQMGNSWNNVPENELDAILLQLVQEAQKHPFKSSKRQKALGKMWQIIHESGKLYRLPAARLPAALSYQEVYTEAFSNLQFYICDRIDEYNPDRASVLAWINFLFKNRFIGNSIKELVKNSQRFIPNLSTLDEYNPLLDRLLTNNQSPCLSDALRQLLLEDPDGIFTKPHIRERQDANFQTIAVCYLDGMSWQQISKKFGIKERTLIEFFQRQKKQLAPIIKTYLQT